ncbi:MAG: hypothetical protein M0R06_22280 [Sphaerochaeta sp.]|jgi:hypothetical protein|nr:hypothetical protein [Sphaerochaeta sp.]
MAYTPNRAVSSAGGTEGRQQFIWEIAAATVADKPGILSLVAVNDSGVRTPYFYWTDSNGILRQHTSIPTNQDSDGSAVGAAASVTLDTAYDNGATVNGAISPGTAIKLGGAGASDNVSIYHDATDLYFTVNAGDLRITAADDIFLVATGGNIDLGSSALGTTGTINIGADSVNLTLGASGATDAYIQFNGTDLILYSSLAGAQTLSSLASPTLTNPTVTGDLTITDGKHTWTDAAAEVAGAWTFSNTTTDAIQITSGDTTGNVLSITANSITTNGAALYVASSLTAGYFAEFYNGAANVFTVGRYGATVIGGNAGTDVLTVTAGDVQLTAGDIDIDLGVITIDNTADEGNTIKRNNATGTAPVLEIEETHATGGTTLLIDSNATDANDALQVTHDGTGYGLSVIGTAVTGKQALFQGPASQTVSSVVVDGTTGSWIGAAATGMLHLSSDGALVADASLLRISSTGAISAANDGACLEVVETGAAKATTYAVRIASTSNEALHVDTGLSLFDERITITLDDNTGPALAITNPDTTGNTNAVTIAPSGSGAGLQISPQEADTMAISVVGLASSTVSQIKVDGSAGAGWLGAANIGMLHLVNDGTYADVAASELYIGNSGVPVNDSRGHCLRIVDTGNAAAGTMAYPVYISSNDATVGGVYLTTAAGTTALNVAAGKASFAEIATFATGLCTYCADTDTANPPTNANMISAFGAAATVGAGFIGIIDDANGHANEYICWSDGTKFWYVTGTAGA